MKFWKTSIISTAVGFSVLLGSQAAQAVPTVEYAFQHLDSNSARCLRKAQRAFSNADFNIKKRQNDKITASIKNYTAVIDCSQETHRGTLSVIIVAAKNKRQSPHSQRLISYLKQQLTDDNQAHYPNRGRGGRGEALNAAAFNRYMKQLQDSWPRRVEFVKRSLSDRHFTAAQASQIVASMNFSSEEEEVAVFLYSRVVDPVNWYLVEDAFTFRSSRDDVRRRIPDFSVSSRGRRR